MSENARVDSASTSVNTFKLKWPFLACLVIAVATVAFTVMATRNIRLPGLNADEVIQVTPALRLVTGNQSMQVPSAGRPVNFGTHWLAIMTSGYIGTVKTLVFAPVIAVFGAGPI